MNNEGAKSSWDAGEVDFADSDNLLRRNIILSNRSHKKYETQMSWESICTSRWTIKVHKILGTRGRQFWLTSLTISWGEVLSHSRCDARSCLSRTKSENIDRIDKVMGCIRLTRYPLFSTFLWEGGFPADLPICSPSLTCKSVYSGFYR